MSALEAANSFESATSNFVLMQQLNVFDHVFNNNDGFTRRIIAHKRHTGVSSGKLKVWNQSKGQEVITTKCLVDSIARRRAELYVRERLHAASQSKASIMMLPWSNVLLPHRLYSDNADMAYCTA